MGLGAIPDKDKRRDGTKLEEEVPRQRLLGHLSQDSFPRTPAFPGRPS